MAQDPNADAPKELSLDDLDWPDAPADGSSGSTTGSDGSTPTEPTKDQPVPGGGIFDRTTRTVDANGNVDVDLTGVIKEVDTPWKSGGSKRDSDGDGLSDEFERMHHTDPNNADTDGDGFSDSTEMDWGMGTATIWSPPNATADDVDGDGVSNTKEIQQGTSPSIDSYAAAGLGSDAVTGADRYYQRHKTGDPIGDASLRAEYNVPATPQEQKELDDAITDQLFSDNPMTRLRAEDALANFDDAKVPQRAKDEANQFLQQQIDNAVNDALATKDPAKIAGALRIGQMTGGLPDAQNAPLEAAFRDILAPPGAKAGAGAPGSGGPGAGGAGGGTGGGTGAGTGTGSDGTTSGDDPGMGAGAGRFGGRDTSDIGGTGGGTGGGGAATEPGTAPTPTAADPVAPMSSTPGWLDAADSLTAGNVDASDTQGVGAMGSRGGDGGGGVGLSIGALGTKSDGIGNTPATSTTPPTTQQPGGGVGGDRDTQPANPASDSVNPVTRPDGTVDHYEQPHADGSKSIYTTNGDFMYTIPPASTDGATGSADGTDTGAGTTDDGSNAGNDEPTDDTNDGGVPDDGNSGTATAYVNPDADSTGGGIAFRTPIHGGGFTDGGRGDLPTLDLTGVTPSDPNGTGGVTHVDPDADGTGGGFAFRTPILGDGVTDFGRDLPTIDLGGLTPHDPNDGTNAFGAGDEASSTGDVIVAGSGGGGGAIISGMVFDGGDAFTAQIDTSALELDTSAMQFDDFSAQGMDANMPAPGGDQMGDPDGDGLPFP